MSNKKQRYTVYLFLKTALHVLGGTSTHHQEHIQLYLQHLAKVPDAVDTVVCVLNNRWRYHPKHVEQFLEINKLCKVASCWIYIYRNVLTIHGPLNFKPYETLSDINICVIIQGYS